jgi:hypothetical protein
MSNRNFNKQTTNARQGFASGSMVRPLDNIRSKGDKMKESLIGSKEIRDKLRKFKSDMRKKKYAPEFKKKSTLLPKSKNSDLIDKMKKMERPKPKKLSESPERIKRQADYMKKHGKNEPRRKTLSVKNTYKKEVEGLKK